MPRMLPWKQNASDTQARRKLLTKSSTMAPKRKRVKSQTLDSDSEGRHPITPKGLRSSRAPSSSPPPSPPSESFMREGLEQDDKYRMVEDELLGIAQKFTVHLHAAEYKNQQKMAQSRNAQTISSISRPTVGKMPDNTRRRLEGIKRSETQRATLGKMVEKATVSDDSDSGDGLPYVGTTLHGLMDSPRRRTISLAKIAPTATTTRSAAGFSKRAAHSKDPMYDSPRRKNITLLDPEAVEGSTASSDDDDDDLDAPAPAPRLAKKETSPPTIVKTSFAPGSIFRRKDVSQVGNEANNTALGSSFVNQERIRDAQGHLTDITSPSSISSSRPRVSRLERARHVKEKEERELEMKKPRDIIPAFL